MLSVGGVVSPAVRQGRFSATTDYHPLYDASHRVPGASDLAHAVVAVTHLHPELYLVYPGETISVLGLVSKQIFVVSIRH